MEKRSLDVKSNGPIVMPAVIVSVGGWEASNLITLAYVGKVAAEPPVMSVSIRPSRHSFSLIEGLAEFVINVPGASPEHLHAVDFCGTRTGREIDKWKELNLTKQKGYHVRVPLIKEFPWNFECRVVKRTEIGTHVCYWGEVLAVHASEETLEGGSLEAAKQNQLLYIAGNYYRIETLPWKKQGYSIRP